MKHKFKPSVGGNRGKRKREEPPSRGEKPSPAPTVDHQPGNSGCICITSIQLFMCLNLGNELQSGEGVASLVPETGPSPCNDSCQSRSGVVPDDHLEQRNEEGTSTTGDGKLTENCGEVVENVQEKEQELNAPLQVLCVHCPTDLYICYDLMLSKYECCIAIVPTANH